MPPRRTPPAAEGSPPAFKPDVESLSVNYERTVRTGKYESAQVFMGLKAVPDKNFSTGENLDRLTALLRHKVDSVCEQIDAEETSEPASPAA